jgi:hypothetical protein
MMALAGCMTTGGGKIAPVGQRTELQARIQQAKAELSPPETLTACGRSALPGNEIFEICGLGPDGQKTKAATHQVLTEICGPIEVTDEMKAYFCQKADAMFDAMNPYRKDNVIAAGFPNKTRAFYSAEFGNEIHYLAPGGKGYFWLANQRNVLRGEWIVYRNQQVCYSVSGITEHAGTKWRCGPVRSTTLAEIANGDILGLAKLGGAPAPWVLQPLPHVTLAEAKQRLDSMPKSKTPSDHSPDQGPSAPVPADPLGPMVMNESPVFLATR